LPSGFGGLSKGLRGVSLPAHPLCRPEEDPCHLGGAALGLLLLALQTLVLLAVSGTQGLTALGGVAYATNRRPAQAA